MSAYSGCSPECFIREYGSDADRAAIAALYPESEVASMLRDGEG